MIRIFYMTFNCDGQFVCVIDNDIFDWLVGFIVVTGRYDT